MRPLIRATRPLDGEAEAIMRKAIEMAKAGDMVALRLCLERIVPPRKERLSPFTLPELKTAADAMTASAALIQAVAAGELTTGQAAELGKLVEAFVRAIETTDMEGRVAELEARAGS